ncbi:MAG: 30S ribosomal protein S10 [Thermoplasmata archaeon]|nr:30S ribosomal protein S10 [Thermoplasmata archaeon]RLF28861.1 MAG: 30S ribosomal protein S10 [Thermoplasmata archaeon]HDJ27497.1 30S ribosomal protein S10 [Aciduliprofundum sp.]
MARYRARITLYGTDHRKLDEVAMAIKNLVLQAGEEVHGPVPLPTRRLVVPVRKSPCGQGSETYERWEMRIHKRLLDLNVDDRVLRRILKIQIPDEVKINIELLT